MRELSVDLFSTVDGYGDGGPQSAPYWGYGGPGLFDWINRKLADEHIMLMGATSYRLMSKIVAEQDDPTFPAWPNSGKSCSRKPSPSPPGRTRRSSTSPSRRPYRSSKPRPTGCRCAPSAARPWFGSLFELGLVDRIRTMIFPTIHGTAGEGPLYAELPDLRLNLTGTTVIDDRLVLLDYRVEGN